MLISRVIIKNSPRVVKKQFHVLQQRTNKNSVKMRDAYNVLISRFKNKKPKYYAPK